jgi:hypothetical protein
MSVQYSVILRAINDNGQKYDLEVVDIPQFLLDISAIELGQIGSVFGISSQNFTLPGSDINNQFFNNVFDLGATPAVALNKSVPCQVLVDGQAVFSGKLYIQNLISDEYNNVIYNCVVTNETVDFRVLTENQGLAELNWAPYSHSYSYASISQSWNDQLFSGSIFYPLVNYGANPLDVNSPGFEFGGAKYQMDNPTTPLKVSQFKPAVQAKTIVDEIFNNINYKYTSSFFNSQLFKDLYFLNSVDDKDGVSFVTSTSGSYVFANTTQSVASGFTTLAPTKLVFNQTVFNAGNNFDLATDSYTADFTGNHIININIPYNITSNFGPLQQTNFGRQLVVYISNGTTYGTILHTVKTKLLNATSGVISTGNISLNLTAGQTISVFFALQTPSSNGREQFTTVVTAGQNGVYLKVQTPQNPIGGTVDISKVFGDLKTLDFMKSLIEKFNLVIEPVENEKNILRIEPYNDWINLGSRVDWTDIVDRSVKYQVSHPIQSLPKTFKFSDSEDADILNQYQKSTYGNIYGTYTYLTDSDLADGEREIGGFYAATPVKGIPTKGTNGTTVLPWMVKQTAGKYAEPFNFKPRLLFKQPIKNIPNNEMYGTATGSFAAPSGSTFYYIDDPAASGVRALSYYRTLLATTDSPTLFTSSLDIHYANIGYYPYQQSAVNGQCQDGVYNRYWAYYINSLYDIDARLLTCNIVLNPADIKNIKLNDKIFIDGHLYRINKISGANLVQQQSTVVELIKLPTRTQPFTGRRRIPTGMNPEDYIDVITNDFSDNGSVSYVRYDDGTAVTDADVLSYVATLDNLEAYGSEVSWNTQQPTNINPNIIILGNTKYNETQNNVIVVGTGNTMPDNLYGTSIFGDNNEINLTQPTSSLGESNLDITNNVIMASNASISDSNGIVLIQPSGSRTISNSQNSVLLNPINDVTAADPTGSVYTGNLRNQGTADFAQGATMTGSVDITGSLCVNGDCWPFGITPAETGSFLITASYSNPNLTFTKGNGSTFDVVIPSGGSGSGLPASYISVYDTTDQTLDGPLTSSVFTFNNIDFYNGITLVSGSQFTVSQSGVYNLEFSAQLDKTNSSNSTAYIWLRKNGINVSESNTSVTLAGGANDRVVAAWNLYVSASANDYYELAWTADDDNTYLQAVNAVPGVFPAIPSIIATMGSVGGSGGGTTIDTGSLVTTSSFNAFTSSINAYTSSLNAVTASFATTGSNTFIGNQTITGSLTVTGSINFLGLGNYADDTSAAAGGVAIGQIYRNGNFIVIRIS